MIAGCLCVVAVVAVAAAAEKKEKGPTLPDGLKGFSGQLQGVVAGVQEDGLGFQLKVDKVTKVWKNNKAKEPEAAVGKTLLINAQWVKGENGKWRPNENHVKFIKSLKADENLTIEVRNAEGQRLHILELSQEQRERAK
jgi:hypothetical protein